MSRSAALLRVRSPQFLVGSEIGIPLPPSHAAAAPAASVSGAAAWLLPCLVFAPLPLRSWCAARAGRLRRAIVSVSGLLRRRCPVLRRASRGRGVSCWGSLRLQAASLGRGLCAPCYCLSRLAAAPCCRLGAKARPLHGRLAGCALLPRCRLGASRPAPLFPPAVLPAAAGSRCAVCSPAAKAYQNCTEKHRKASKSPLFVRHIAASVPVCVN